MGGVRWIGGVSKKFPLLVFAEGENENLIRQPAAATFPRGGRLGVRAGLGVCMKKAPRSFLRGACLCCYARTNYGGAKP